jgi:hypothetical protein
MTRVFQFAVITSILTVFGCGHATIHNFEPADEEQHKAILFGFIRVDYAGRDRTQDAVVYFEDGQTLQLETEGFVAIHVVPGRVGVYKIKIENETTGEYALPNLSLRSGFPGTKTYFGNITLHVDAPGGQGQADVDEKWTWKVENRWKEAWTTWNRIFGPDKRKFFSAIAERRGPEKVQTRALATDRQEVVPGF